MSQVLNEQTIIESKQTCCHSQCCFAGDHLKKYCNPSLLSLTRPSLAVFFCSATKPRLFGRTLDTNSATGPSQKPVVRQTKQAKDLLDIGTSLYHISLLPYPISPLKSYISAVLFFLSEYMSSKNWLRVHKGSSFPFIEFVSPFTH